MLDHRLPGVIGRTDLYCEVNELNARSGREIEAASKASPPVVLTIAGFDPSSGAGITADLKVFAAHHLYGLSAITALTVQSTQGVKRTEAVHAETLEETLRCLAEDVTIAGVKIGMLATAGNVSAVRRFLESASILPGCVVLDPILRSSSGRELLDAEGVKALRSELLGLVGWITPNREELAVLLKESTLDPDRIPFAAEKLQRDFPALSLVVTGGDANPPHDFLRTAGGEEHWFPGERIETTATHGTGCTFSSALLANLLAGKSPVEAVQSAKDYVREAMQAAYRIGKGKGPLHHLYRFGSAK
jgi:hydroxymethylpyrimidine/phosphomethylpyrimidine kinase